MEVNVVSAYYILEEPEKGVTSIGYAGNRTLSISSSQIAEITGLAKELLEIVNAKTSGEQSRLLELAKKIPSADFIKHSMLEIKPGIKIDVSKRRNSNKRLHADAKKYEHSKSK